MTVSDTGKLSTIRCFIPLLLWLVYSLTTIFVFEFGPLDFRLTNKPLLYTYLFLAHIAIGVGYYHGFRKTRALKDLSINTHLLRSRSIKLLTWLALSFIFVNFIRDFSAGVSIVNTSIDAMDAKNQYSKARSGGPLGYISAVLTVAVIPFLVLGVASFSRLSNFSRATLVALVLRIIYDSALGASRAGLFMLVIVLFSAALLLIDRGSVKFLLRRLMIVFIPLVFFFLLYSSFIAVTRQTVVIENMAEYMSHNSRYDFNADNFLVPQFEGSLSILNAGVLTGYFYFTHGYQGLHDALDLPFGGVGVIFGHSDFMVRNLARVFGDSALTLSLHYRLVEEQKSLSTLWVTAYTNIASDVGFSGSLVILYFFGYMFAKSFIKAIKRPSILDYACFGWLSYFFYQINMTFVPADLGAFLAFWGTIFLAATRFSTGRRLQH